MDVEGYLRRRYESQIADIEIVEKEDLDLVSDFLSLSLSLLIFNALLAFCLLTVIYICLGCIPFVITFSFLCLLCLLSRLGILFSNFKASTVL